MKRILLIGTPSPDRLEWYYAKAFRRLGVDLSVFDPETVLQPLIRNRFVRRATQPFHHQLVHRGLLSCYRQPAWDAVFVVKGYDLAAETIQACKRRATAIPWAVLNPDSPFESGRGSTSRHIRESMELFDLYFIWSRELLPRLRQAGVSRPRYLPFARDEGTHFPVSANEADPSLERTITFVGTYDAARAQMLESIADLPLMVFGDRWERLPRRSSLRKKTLPGMARGPALRRIVTSSLVSLNILRPQNHGAHNMRTFEVPAMRGVMLTNRSEEQRAFFPEGEACLMYGSDRELRDRLREVLANAYDLTAMREVALERASHHTYVERAREVCRQLDALS